LAAGDGIRTEAEALANLLQSHAGAHFTFALVAIELFETQDRQFLAVPRTIAKTALIERGVVRIEDGRVVVAPPTVAGRPPGQRTTMTEELFFELMAARNPELPQALRDFIDKAALLGVRPDWRASLNFKWYSDRVIANLGYVRKDGTLTTDATFYTARGAAAARHYIEAFAKLSGGKLVQNNDVIGPYVIAADGKSSLQIDQVLPAKADAWLDLISTFIKAMELEAIAEPA
jgi:hypothetical protein